MLYGYSSEYGLVEICSSCFSRLPLKKCWNSASLFVIQDEELDAMDMSTLLKSPSLSRRPTYSCLRCSDRKVRCDRQNPCSTCVKHHVQCFYRAPPQPRKKQKRVKQGNLKEKVQRYETLLQNLGVDSNGLPNTSDNGQPCGNSGPEVPLTEDALQVPTPASTVPEMERSITTSQLLQGQGRSKFVDKLVQLP